MRNSVFTFGIKYHACKARINVLKDLVKEAKIYGWRFFPSYYEVLTRDITNGTEWETLARAREKLLARRKWN